MNEDSAFLRHAKKEAEYGNKDPRHRHKIMKYFSSGKVSRSASSPLAPERSIRTSWTLDTTFETIACAPPANGFEKALATGDVGVCADFVTKIRIGFRSFIGLHQGKE